MRRILAALVLLLVLAGAGLWAFRGPIALKLFTRQVEKTLKTDAIAELPDGLHVGLCGSGSPIPGPDRAGPCVVVIAGQRMYLVDAGEGGARNLNRMGFSPGRLSAVFLTHFHSDHIDGLGGLLLQRWGAAAAKTALPVYGPTGVDVVVGGFNQAYSLDHGYRVAHHGPEVMPPEGFGGDPQPFEPAADGSATLLLDQDGVKVFAFAVDHGPVHPAVGYVFTYKGRKVVISGDTRKTASVQAAAQDADVLVHEALSPAMVKLQEDAANAAGKPNLAHIFHDIVGYHTTPHEAAEIARDAHVRYLLLDHIVPPLPIEALEGPFLDDARSVFSGPIRIGRDGDLVSLPAGSTEVTYRRRF